MRVIFLSASLLAVPTLSVADTIPIYHQEGNDLYYTGEKVTLAEGIRLTGGDFNGGIFGPPQFIAKSHNGHMASYVTPLEFELVMGGDGEISGEPDDLTFEEHEGLDTRDDLIFDEGEGTDTHDDLTFDESEGHHTRDDLTFEENEGLDLREGTALSKNDDQTTQDDLVFNETEGTKVGDDLTFSEEEAIKHIEAEGVPRHMLENAYGSTVTPQDGTWTALIQEAVATGCPPGAAEQAKAQIMRSNVLNITFSKPNWHPSDLGGELGQFTWTKIGQNGYFSHPYTTGAEAEGSGVSLAVSTAYSVRSSTIIDTWYRVQVNLAPALAAMAGGSEECEVLILGELSK